MSYSIIYQTTLELKNMSSASRHVHVIPPTTAYFSIGLGRLLICYTVHIVKLEFANRSLCNYLLQGDFLVKVVLLLQG